MPKMKAAVVLAVGAAALVLSALALASGGAYRVSASLTAKQEVPAPKAPAGAKGSFTGTLTQTAKGGKLKWKLTFSGLSGKAAAAHIHLGARGKSGPVMVALCGPCRSGQAGTAVLTKDQRDAIEHGRTYVNVHTAKNGAGEIRGQVKATET